MTATNQRALRDRAPLEAAFWRSLRRAHPWQLILAASGWITMLGILTLPPGSPALVMLVFCFVLVCPGFAVSRLLPIREPAERWVLAVALSMSFAILVGVALTVLRIGSAALGMGLLALITTVAAAIDMRLSLRTHGLPSTRNEEVQP